MLLNLKLVGNKSSNIIIIRNPSIMNLQKQKTKREKLLNLKLVDNKSSNIAITRNPSIMNILKKRINGYAKEKIRELLLTLYESRYVLFTVQFLHYIYKMYLLTFLKC